MQVPEMKEMVEKMQIYLRVNTRSLFLEAVGGCILFSISLFERKIRK
jgi:hypothetical protein